MSVLNNLCRATGFLRFYYAVLLDTVFYNLTCHKPKIRLRFTRLKQKQAKRFIKVPIKNAETVNLFTPALKIKLPNFRFNFSHSSKYCLQSISMHYRPVESMHSFIE